MSRVQLEPGCLYHIYNHAVGKDKLFLSDDNYLYFLRRYQDFIPLVADTLAYCLVSNHIHFLVDIKDKINLPEGLKYSESQFVSRQFANLFSSYTQAFNKQQKRMGNLFMSNFNREKIGTDEYLSNLIRYIHLNPVRHKVVKTISQWKFSSYNALCSGQRTFLASEKTIGWFGGIDEFKKFHEEDESTPRNPWEQLPESLGNNFPKV